MADYAGSINITDYLYKRTIILYNSSSDKYNAIFKLTLNSSQFNFSLCEVDGRDFRVVEQSNNTDILCMWIAKWDSEVGKAVIFFKLPFIAANSNRHLSVYWGSKRAISISDPVSVGLLFYDTFSSKTLSSKWYGYTSSTISKYGYTLPSYTTEGKITTTTNPLLGVSDWVVEVGFYNDFDDTTATATSAMSVGIGLVGIENDFLIKFLQTDMIYHNAINPDNSTFYKLSTDYGGLEGYSYNEAVVMYESVPDIITVKLLNRNTFKDAEYEISRKVEGDTTPYNVSIYGPENIYYINHGSTPSYVQWAAIRSMDSYIDSDINISDLYIPYETVNHQDQDIREYSGNIDSVQYRHVSDFGGNPYNIINGSATSDIDSWLTSISGASQSYVSFTTYTAWGLDVTSDSYLHYDSGHSDFRTASKLSDNIETGQTYWGSTTSSGWASIRFPSKRKIGAFGIKATTVSGAMPKDYALYGSNANPLYYGFSSCVLLKSGTFYQTSAWQYFVVDNSNYYTYYTLNISNTYSNSPIVLYNWEMMDNINMRTKSRISQLRLSPCEENQKAFPREISLLGSSDGVTWSTILDWTRTYTPFVEHIYGYGLWQRYSFYNINAFWYYKLLCRGNWGDPNGYIGIGEWSIHELLPTTPEYRIIAGSSNNINQIWTSPEFSFDDSAGQLFAANTVLSIVNMDKLKTTKVLPSTYYDINIV